MTAISTQSAISSPAVHIDEQEARWFAVYTMHKREKLVVQRLQERGITGYVPLLLYTRRYQRKIRQVELPLINGYVFAKITRKEYVPVLETADVFNFVKFNKQLIAIPEVEIKTLQRITGEGIEIEAQSLDQWMPGDAVEVIAGNLTGLRGKLVGKGNKNFVVELHTLGYALHMEIDPKALLRLRGGSEV